MRTDGSALRFAGYAARFDRLDHGGDIVRSGAFRATLAKGRTIPLLWQHKTGTVVGRIEQVREDDRGLRVICQIESRGIGRDLADLIRTRRLDGLSFGYRVQKARKLDSVRELIDLDLIEVSLPIAVPVSVGAYTFPVQLRTPIISDANGDVGNGRAIVYGTAPPTSGLHLQGELVLNSGAAPGGFAGWICTASGSPGSWKTFGSISA